MRKIILCVKEVPNTDKIQIDYEKGLLKRESTHAILNPPDETALQWALELKKKHSFHVTVISMGPPKTIELLQYILSLGLDRGFLISDSAFSGSDTLATSFILSETIRLIGGSDLIFFGSHSLDGDTGQVPGESSEFLGIPSFSNILDIKLKDSALLSLEQDLEEKRIIEASFPCSISFTESKKKYLLFPHAKAYFLKKEISILSNQDLKLPINKTGLKGSPTQVIKVWPPQVSRHAQIEYYSPEVIPNLLNRIKNF